MNQPWHMTVDVIDGERYLSADEAEERLCDVIMDIKATERHWDALRGIDPRLQVAASVFHPEISSKMWSKMPDSIKRAAIQNVGSRELMVRNAVHAVMQFYVEEDQMQ
jgi:hypothetical protein